MARAKKTEKRQLTPAQLNAELQVGTVNMDEVEVIDEPEAAGKAQGD